MATLNFTGKDFYVYLHRRSTDGIVFYVGKGTKNRSHSRKGRSQEWLSIKKDHGLTVEITESGMQEWWAFEVEKDLILTHRSIHLTNIADGGHGPLGMTHTDASKDAMRIAKTGIKRGPHSELHKLKISMANIGHYQPRHTDEAKRKIAEASRNQTWTDQRRANVSAGLMGKRPSEAVKARLSESHGGKPIKCMETGEVFYGASPAARWLQQIGHKRASAGGVSNAASGRASHAYGFHWSYNS